MAKKITAYIKLQVKAGEANPSPPVGPALGQRGVNIMEFCKAFNAKTQSMEPGLPIPVGNLPSFRAQCWAIPLLRRTFQMIAGFLLVELP